ncbi:hypothetical protein DENSPDRAFT_753064, partial [Dentipellis sp. KUC8613]
QLLGMTCDNASPNDVMVEKMADLIEGFPGQINRTRCFAHVAKSMLSQFDVPK